MITLAIEDKKLDDQFRAARKEWDSVYRNGGDTGGVFTDGQYLNLIRWKLIELKRKIKEKSGKEELDLTEFDIPIKVAFTYDAKRKAKRKERRNGV